MADFVAYSRFGLGISLKIEEGKKPRFDDVQEDNNHIGLYVCREDLLAKAAVMFRVVEGTGEDWSMVLTDEQGQKLRCWGTNGPNNGDRGKFSLPLAKGCVCIVYHNLGDDEAVYVCEVTGSVDGTKVQLLTEILFEGTVDDVPDTFTEAAKAARDAFHNQKRPGLLYATQYQRAAVKA